MGQLVGLDLKKCRSVLVEVDSPASGPVTRGRAPAEAIVKAGETLETVLGRLGPAIRAIVSELRKAADLPDEVEVEFAVQDFKALVQHAAALDGWW